MLLKHILFMKNIPLNHLSLSNVNKSKLGGGKILPLRILALTKKTLKHILVGDFLHG